MKISAADVAFITEHVLIALAGIRDDNNLVAPPQAMRRPDQAHQEVIALLQKLSGQRIQVADGLPGEIAALKTAPKSLVEKVKDKISPKKK